MWRFLFIVLSAELIAYSVGKSVHDAIANGGDSNDSTSIMGLQDTDTPRGERLTAIYKKSFAYGSIRDRLPTILQKLIDYMRRDAEEIARRFGADSSDELQYFMGNVSELRNDLVTNKPLTTLPLANSEFDVDIKAWNDKLKSSGELDDEVLTFYDSPFLLSECYMYRRMNQLLARTRTIKAFDPFEKQKQESFTRALKSLTSMANHTLELSRRNFTKFEQNYEFLRLLKLDLWGNRFDLSLTGGAEINSEGNPLDLLDSYDENLIVNDTKLVWEVLNTPDPTKVPTIVDFVLDNAGFELFSDMCLASFLVTQGLARKVRFYVKRMPWVLSDVNRHDIIWSVDYMQNSSDPVLKAFGDVCAGHLKNGDWTIETEAFWTEPYDFGEMKEKSPALYAKLSEAALIVIKGGLNYRKLIGDINWDHTTTLKTVLTSRDFRPTNLVSIATLKADICVGLEPGKTEILNSIDENWMINGKYGIINAFAKSGNLNEEKQL